MGKVDTNIHPDPCPKCGGEMYRSWKVGFTAKCADANCDGFKPVRFAYLCPGCGTTLRGSRHGGSYCGPCKRTIVPVSNETRYTVIALFALAMLGIVGATVKYIGGL